MTEAEWQACDNPEQLRAFLGDRLSARRWRLFACAVCRDPDLWAQMPAEERAAVEAAERRAERATSVQELKAARSLTKQQLRRFSWCAYWAAAPGARRKDMAAAVRYVLLHALLWERQVPGLRPRLCGLLREVAGSPIQPVQAVSAWLEAHAAAAPAIARAIYEERAFDRLPLLADALEDAGCTDAALLGHLRGPGPHVRGCWALDLVLGRPDSLGFPRRGRPG
jgi:hypothetical protein